MANSVDSDQTTPEGAVWSGSTLFVYAILSETLENIWDRQKLVVKVEWSKFRVVVTAEFYRSLFDLIINF